MNKNVYLFETIEECKKQIINNSIKLDIAYESNSALFKYFMNTFKGIMFFGTLLGIIIFNIIHGFVYTMHFLLIMILVTILLSCIISFAEYNFKKSYEKTKINLVTNMIESCKEYKNSENDYESWERKRIIENMMSLANLTVEWDNNAK